MSSPEPPSKRRRLSTEGPSPSSSPAFPNQRRFFTDPEDVPCPRPAQDAQDGARDASNNPPSQDAPSIDSASLRSPPQISPHLSVPLDATPPPFETTLRSLVGDVPADALDRIRDYCGDNMEQAVNMYLDGTWKKLKRKTFALHPPRPTPSSLPQHPPSSLGPSSLSPFPRYIGSFGVEGWATRSGSLVKHGDSVRIERQKIQPPQTAIRTKNKLGAVVVQHVNASAARRVDVIVRFTTAGGAEIGRLAKDTAHWMSALMDQQVCEFAGTCIYAPERLRTNDTVYLQLRCSLLATAFSTPYPSLSDNRISALEQDETAEERRLRQRQVALVRLLQEVNLVPVKSSVAAAKHQRQDMLEAAELAERREREKEKDDEDEDGRALEQDQLDALYRKAQSFDFSTPQAEPAPSFAMTLRPYQKQSLHWMLAKERNQQNQPASMHPLWEEYRWPTRDHDDRPVESNGKASFYLNPYSGDLSVEFPVQQQHCLGGVLADEMGLGKTIQILSLIHTHRPEAAIASRQPSSMSLPRLSGTPLDAPCTTLVVAPMSLLAQWQSEAERASRPNSLKTLVYYGADKTANLQALCCTANAASAPDLVVTSYGVVLSEFGKRGGLFSLRFLRLVLDEAHTIKNRQSKTARACYALGAIHRWALTGTPIVNRLEDLFSLVRFLRVEPWSSFSFWRTFVTVPFESRDFVRALDVVQTVLEPLVMRRTKDMTTPDGLPLVPLPSKTMDMFEVELSAPERAVYDHILARAQRSLQASVDAGTVARSFVNIQAQILRLRQSCCHPVLVRRREEEEAEVEVEAEADGLADDTDLQTLIARFAETTDTSPFTAHALRQIRDEAASECPICAEEPMADQTVTACWHSACKPCLLDYTRRQQDRHEPPRCFQCREPVDPRDLFEVVRDEDEPSRIRLQRVGSNSSSAKIVALVSQLRALRRQDPTVKSVVFSQFTSFLSLIEAALARAGMRTLRLDGTMAQRARASVLAEFREAPSQFTVLLVSLRAGGVGLNLTSARRVFMMDPWWSFAVEAQAIDRVHRMGQEDEVRVVRFIARDSVEERMLKIQERKKFIASSLGMTSDDEKKTQRIEDIKELLGVSATR